MGRRIRETEKEALKEEQFYGQIMDKFRTKETEEDKRIHNGMLLNIAEKKNSANPINARQKCNIKENTSRKLTV